MPETLGDSYAPGIAESPSRVLPADRDASRGDSNSKWFQSARQRKQKKEDSGNEQDTPRSGKNFDDVVKDEINVSDEAWHSVRPPEVQPETQPGGDAKKSDDDSGEDGHIYVVA